MNMTATFLTKFISAINASNRRNGDIFFSKIEIISINWKLLIEFVVFLIRKLKNIIIMSKSFYFSLKLFLHLYYCKISKYDL